MTLPTYSPTNGAWTDPKTGRLTAAAQLWLRDLWLRVGGANGLTHGDLAGLADDDHTQYLTAARGDLRYQPLDSDLTAIAALSTTAFGRALLALVGSPDMTATAFGGLPVGTLAPAPAEVVVKQSGAWVRLAWADFLTLISGVASASLDFSQASNSQYIGAVHI